LKRQPLSVAVDQFPMGENKSYKVVALLLSKHQYVFLITNKDKDINES